MTGGETRPAALPQSFGRLRLRLTAWYAGTFFAILTLLGIAMFAAITARFDSDLDSSLSVAANELARVVRARAAEGLATKAILDPATDFRIPDRTLIVVDSTGSALDGRGIDSPLRRVALDAAGMGTAGFAFNTPMGLRRARAVRFRTAAGQTLVAIAVASEIEVEDRYAALIAAFGAAGLAAVALVAAGGWLLARKSSAPVERAVLHMRRFMADAAHELRTPLAVVRSRADVALQRSRTSEDYVQALTGISREAERLGRIVEDLLTLARADAGERPIERRRVFVDDVTLDAAEAARAIAERKAVRLEVDAFEEAPVDGDETLLRQLAMILLDNAIKFTPTDGSVRVGVRSSPAGAVLSVSDTGIGIEPSQLPHIFERFYRGDPARTPSRGRENGSSQGAGLGLSIARWIADEHGASITIESAPAHGTRVDVHFPLAATAPLVSSS
jgi:signal transduction histidine kinase